MLEERKNILNKVGGFNNKYHIIGDFDFLVRLSLICEIEKQGRKNNNNNLFTFFCLVQRVLISI